MGRDTLKREDELRKWKEISNCYEAQQFGYWLDEEEWKEWAKLYPLYGK